MHAFFVVHAFFVFAAAGISAMPVRAGYIDLFFVHAGVDYYASGRLKRVHTAYPRSVQSGICKETVTRSQGVCTPTDCFVARCPERFRVVAQHRMEHYYWQYTCAEVSQPFGRSH